MLSHWLTLLLGILIGIVIEINDYKVNFNMVPLFFAVALLTIIALAVVGAHAVFGMEIR